MIILLYYYIIILLYYYIIILLYYYIIILSYYYIIRSYIILLYRYILYAIYNIPGCDSEGIPPYSSAALPRSTPLKPTASVAKFGLRRLRGEAVRKRSGSMLGRGPVARRAFRQPGQAGSIAPQQGDCGPGLPGQVGSIA